MLRVTWSYSHTVNGLPSEQDLRRIAQLEDDFSDALKEGLKSKLVMSETGDGVRLWLFYIHDDIEVEPPIRQISLKHRVGLVFSTKSDPAWNYLQRVRSRVR